MNKKVAILIAITVVTSLVILFLKISWVKNIVTFKNGTAFVVEDLWMDGDTVYLKKDNKIVTVYLNEIRHITESGYKGPAKIKKAILSRLAATWKKLIIFFRLEPIGSSLHKYWNHIGAGDRTWIIISLVLALLAVGGAIAFAIKHYYLKIGGPGDSKIGRAIFGSDTNTIPISNSGQPVLTPIQEVEVFFLDLFRKQLGAPKDAPGKIVSIQDQDSGSERVYELQVKWRNEKKTRRITISPLGEDSGSKSQCFYAIYDTHIVVKIPPEPISDFKDYIRRIREETAIVSKLSPTECIIPNVAVILQMIKTFPNADNLTAKALESKYIYWVEGHLDFQDFLKVGGAFAFFMDLSKYYFLRHIIDSFHDVRKEIDKEMNHDMELISDPGGFGYKYGYDNDELCFALQRAYTQFDHQLKRLESKPGNSKQIADRLKKTWFFAYLVGKNFSDKHLGLPNHLVGQTANLLNKITAENSSTVTSYQRLFNASINKNLFNRNRLKMGGVITNLLVLLGWLGQKKISMRDLKPDNLLVAGNPAHYPLFLETPGKYTIGLIDVETAVDFETAGIKKPGQPQLGGTPLYATPSHFFENRLLKDMYKNLPLILHLQDWYAIAGMIYQVVTGNKLFPKTASQIPKIMQTITRSIAQNIQLTEIYKDISRVFWKTARNEFKLRIRNHENKLKAVYAEIPEKTGQWFNSYLQSEKGGIENKIKAFIRSQAVFTSEKQRRGLLGCSYRDICKLRDKYKEAVRTGKSRGKDLTRNLQVLDRLGGYKLREERMSKMIRLLQNDVPTLSAYDVLDIIFRIVLGNMYNTQWKKIRSSQAEDKTGDTQLIHELPKEIEVTLGFTVTLGNHKR